MVGIFLDFTRRTGHEHPHLRVALVNYTDILKAMGRSEAEIETQLGALLAEYGLKLGRVDRLQKSSLLVGKD